VESKDLFSTFYLHPSTIIQKKNLSPSGVGSTMVKLLQHKLIVIHKTTLIIWGKCRLGFGALWATEESLGEYL
jgi:hypothetical protein